MNLNNYPVELTTLSLQDYLSAFELGEEDQEEADKILDAHKFIEKWFQMLFDLGIEM
ncbi:hypothetical protein ACFQ5J_06050 [Lacticaseibacillus baoqingensis]|uniref:Uncharacterized protein n=2 Tax=Lacticaseibacillus baoqingensis TaxID=2486013 RepID=A0ABW4E7J1_9LACO